MMAFEAGQIHKQYLVSVSRMSQTQTKAAGSKEGMDAMVFDLCAQAH